MCTSFPQTRTIYLTVASAIFTYFDPSTLESFTLLKFTIS